MKFLLILLITNSAQVPDHVLANARNRVERIYGDAGIQVVWRAARDEDGKETTVAAQDAVERSLTVRVVITSKCLSGASCGEFVAGMSMGSEGRGSRRAYVFADRVSELGRRFHKKMMVPHPEAIVMAMVIAHEVGHLMLPSGYGHSRKGIMDERLDIHSIDDARRGELVFSPKEADLIRSAFSTGARGRHISPAVLDGLLQPSTGF